MVFEEVGTLYIVTAFQQWLKVYKNDWMSFWVARKILVVHSKQQIQFLLLVHKYKTKTDPQNFAVGKKNYKNQA